MSEHSTYCPFCGSSNLRANHLALSNLWHIRCFSCEMTGPPSKTPRGAELKFRIRSQGEGTPYTLAGKEIKIKHPGFLAFDADLVLEEGEPE